MKHHSGRDTRVWLSCLLLVGCGPMISLESDGSTGDESIGEGTASIGPPPAMVTTDAVTTTPSATAPGDTTLGPLDTGVFDTGEVWRDFPEYCSILDQDCPPGYKCMPYSNDGGPWNDVMCVPLADDPGGPGDPCTVQGSATSGIDDCDESSMCWDVDPDTNEGVCVAHCIGELDDPFCADRCNYCTISNDGPLLLCLPTCDPVLQNCDDDEGCYPVQEHFVCAPDASPPDVGIGSPCEFINVCPPGLICIDSSEVPDCGGFGGCCSPACSVGGLDPCPGLLPGTVCTPWYSDKVEPEGCLVSEPGACMIP